MTIKLRLMGGFGLSLCLTAVVAGVGWKSLDGFGRRVEIATTAQSLGGQAGELQIAAEKAMRGAAGTTGTVQGALDHVRATSKALVGLPGADATIVSSSETMNRSLDTFEKSFAQFLQEQEAKTRLQVAHRVLVDEFQGAVDVIAKAQQANLTDANKSIQGLISSQATLDTSALTSSFVTRSIYELRGMEATYIALGEPDALVRIKTLVKTIGLLAKRLAAIEALKGAAQEISNQVEKYRLGLEDVETDTEKREKLPVLSEALVRTLQGIQSAHMNEATSLRSAFNDAQGKMQVGTELLDLSAQAVVAAKTAQVEEVRLFMTGGKAEADTMDAAAGRLLDATKSISYKITADGERKKVEDLLGKITGYRASIPQIVQANANQAKLLNELAGSLRAVIDQAHGIADAQVERMQGERRNALLFLAGGLALAIVSGLLMALLISRSIVRPMTTLGGAMGRIAKGEFTVELPEAERRDELGEMAKSVVILREAGIEKERIEAEAADHRRAAEEERRLADQERARNQSTGAAAAKAQAAVVASLATGLDRLSHGDLAFRLHEAFPPEYEQLRADFNAAMEKLRETMRTVFGSTHGIKSGTGEISQAADDLSRRTEHQATSIEQTAAALNEITITVQKTAEGAAHAHDIVAAAREDAEHSGAVVQNAVKAMGQIEASATKIGQIIGLIDEIAFQTNLLALNASVEAARAGDSGRGFAVVASEVRALAQRSTDAAKDIKTLISASNAQVATGVQLVGETGEALGRIVTRVSEISGIVSEIAASAKEQATGLTEVNNAVNQMDSATQQNAAMVEESTAACHTLAREADDLAGMISLFRLDGQGQGVGSRMSEAA